MDAIENSSGMQSMARSDVYTLCEIDCLFSKGVVVEFLRLAWLESKLLARSFEVDETVRHFDLHVMNGKRCHAD
jgi:hypothetical protein